MCQVNIRGSNSKVFRHLIYNRLRADSFVRGYMSHRGRINWHSPAQLEPITKLSRATSTTSSEICLKPLISHLGYQRWSLIRVQGLDGGDGAFGVGESGCDGEWEQAGDGGGHLGIEHQPRLVRKIANTSSARRAGAVHYPYGFQHLDDGRKRSQSDLWSGHFSIKPTANGRATSGRHSYTSL